jgi:uncharacterized protein (TIGR02145 family)
MSGKVNEGWINHTKGLFCNKPTTMKRNAIMLILLALFFSVGCSEVEDLIPDNHIDYGSVTDIDGNVYKTVVIGDQEWMAENLRVSRYNNGDEIPTGVSNTEWETITHGAYTIFPHDSISGLNSDEEVPEAYGALYNWYAVNTGNLCPAGWSVPGDNDWTLLLDSLMAKYGFHNYWGISDIHGVGNALKACQQVGSPLTGSNCNTSMHPRWNAHETHYGTNEFGLSLLPGGNRNPSGAFFLLGETGFWWSADEHSANYAWAREASNDLGNIGRFFPDKNNGLSVRCIKD